MVHCARWLVLGVSAGIILLVSVVMLHASETPSYQGGRQAYPLTTLPEKNPVAMLLVGAIDGSLTAFNADEKFSQEVATPLWTIDTKPGPLLSSSLSKIELVKDGVKLQLIPSLDGGLFSFDGESIEPLPVSTDTLLSSSFKVSEDSIITGGKETKIYGLDLLSGQVKYTCAASGCQTFPQNVGNKSEDGTLLISRLSQTVRAFDIHRGDEKWNFSVSSLDVAMAHGHAQGRPELREDMNCAFLGEIEKDVNFQFDITTGLVSAVSSDGQTEQWRFQFKHAITSAWIVRDGCVKELDIMDHVPQFIPPPEVLPDQKSQLIYIGQFDDQLYIQHSRKKIERYPIVHPQFPRVTFRPLLISAPSRTPAIASAYRPFVLPDTSSEANALVPVRPHDYPFDNGYLLASSDTPHPACPTPIQMNNPNEPSILHRLVSYWRSMTGMILLPAIAAGYYFLQYKPRAIQAKSEVLQRQNTASSGTTKSITSVLSLQESGSKASRFQADFEVLPPNPLGKGGFGVVYAARNRLDDNVYAVKKIRLPISEAAREKVRREVKFLAKLDHVGIVRFFNAWVEADDYENHLTKSAEAEDLDVFDGPMPSKCTMTSNTEPTSLESAVSTDLCSDWIGTQRVRRKQSLDMAASPPVLGRSDSVVIVFEDDSNNPSLQPANGGNVAMVDGHVHGLKTIREDEWTIDKTSSVENSRSHGDGLDESVFSESDGGIVFQEESQRLDPQGNPVRRLTPGLDGITPKKRSRSTSTKKSSPSLSGLSDLTDSTGNRDTSRTPVRPQLFIQMELCRKETLKDWLKMNVETRNRNHIMDIFYQIVCAVEYIHGKGLMHRDLKPSNVLFSLDETAVKIADFGLVTSTEDEDVQLRLPLEDLLSIHGHTNQVGTTLYMSPELMAGRAYCEKVDVYSLGLIFLELVTPFHTEMERIQTLKDAKSLKFPLTKYSWSRKNDWVFLKQLLALKPDDRPTATNLRHCDVFRDLLATYEQYGLGMNGTGPGRTRGYSFSFPHSVPHG